MCEGTWVNGWTTDELTDQRIISGSTCLLLKQRLRDRGLAALKPVWKTGRLGTQAAFSHNSLRAQLFPSSIKVLVSMISAGRRRHTHQTDLLGLEATL